MESPATCPAVPNTQRTDSKNHSTAGIAGLFMAGGMVFCRLWMVLVNAVDKLIVFSDGQTATIRSERQKAKRNLVEPISPTQIFKK